MGTGAHRPEQRRRSRDSRLPWMTSSELGARVGDSIRAFQVLLESNGVVEPRLSRGEDERDPSSPEDAPYVERW